MYDVAAAIKEWSPIILPVITAIGSVVAAGATAIIAYLAVKQLPMLVQQLKNAERDRIATAELEKERRTVEACTRYSTDYALFRVKTNIYEQRRPDENPEFPEPKKVQRDIKHLLNYLDGIAVGIHQGLYDQDIVFDNIHPIIIDAVEEFIITEPPGFYCDEQNYLHLVTLYKDFKKDFEIHMKSREEMIAKATEVRDQEILARAAATRYSKDTAKK